jgi:hypothetical protein
MTTCGLVAWRPSSATEERGLILHYQLADLVEFFNNTHKSAYCTTPTKVQTRVDIRILEQALVRVGIPVSGGFRAHAR